MAGLDDLTRRRRLHPPPSLPSRATRKVQRDDVLAEVRLHHPGEGLQQVFTGQCLHGVKVRSRDPRSGHRSPPLDHRRPPPFRASRSAMVVGVGKCRRPLRMPKRLTTRCAGTGSPEASPSRARFMAHPTIRLERAAPECRAMAPLARDPPRRNQPGHTWTSRSKSPLPGRAVALPCPSVMLESAGSGSSCLPRATGTHSRCGCGGRRRNRRPRCTSPRRRLGCLPG